MRRPNGGSNVTFAKQFNCRKTSAPAPGLGRYRDAAAASVQQVFSDRWSRSMWRIPHVDIGAPLEYDYCIMKKMQREEPHRASALCFSGAFFNSPQNKVTVKQISTTPLQHCGAPPGRGSRVSWTICQVDNPAVLSRPSVIFFGFGPGFLYLRDREM